MDSNHIELGNMDDLTASFKAEEGTNASKFKTERGTKLSWKAKFVCGFNSMDLDNPEMSFEDFDFWYEIVCCDDIKLATEVLSDCNKQEQSVLMNSPFVFDTGCLETGEFKVHLKEWRNIVHFCKPLSIAVVSRSRHIVNLLIMNAANYLLLENGDNNIFHVLVIVAHSFPEHEGEYAEIYTELVKHIEDSSALKKLLFQENHGGFRPVELAAHFDVYTMMLAIFETDGVYRISASGLTTLPVVQYDMKEYETWGGGRRKKSPLRSIVYLTQTDMKKDSCDRLFQSPLIQMWIDNKFWNYFGLILVWFLLRSTFLACFLGSGFEKYLFIKKTSVLGVECPEKLATIKKVITKEALESTGFGMWYFLIYGMISLIVDFVEIIAFFTCRRSLKQRNALRFWDLCSFTIYTRISFAVACFIGLLVFLVTRYGLEDISADAAAGITRFGTVAYVFAIMQLIWSHIFFLQLLPKVGHFLIGFQRMLMGFICFILAFLYIFVCFSFSYGRIYLLSCIDKGFSNFVSSLYSTFLVMLNMKSFPVMEPEVAILHVDFIFVVTLLLLNFLIAILTDTQATVSAHITTLEYIQTLDIVLILEDRFGWIYSRIWNREGHFLFTLKRNVIIDDSGACVGQTKRTNKGFDNRSFYA